MEARMEAPSRTRSNGPVLKSMSLINKFYSLPSELAWSSSIQESINRQKKKSHVKKKVQKLKRNESKTKNVPTTREDESLLRMSVFRRMISCAVDRKVRESFVVVKKSKDPYEDFKRSMLEMILEKQMFEVKDLEELLHYFLSPNSRQHHVVIVEAFSEIWEVLFSKSPVMNRRDSKNR